MTYKIGWFSTGRDKAARTLLNTIYKETKKGILANVEISFVCSNRERGDKAESDQFLDLVKKLKLKIVSFPIALYHFDVLAGDMLIWGFRRCKEHDAINLHPALPQGPKGTWQQVIWQIIRDRSLEHGVMIHLVTPELDRGPVVSYCRFSLQGAKFDPLWQKLDKQLKTKRLDEIIEEEGEENPLFMEIRHEGFIREIPLLIHTIKQFAEGNLLIRDKQPFSRSGILETGYDLTEIIDEEIKKHQAKNKKLK